MISWSNEDWFKCNDFGRIEWWYKLLWINSFEADSTITNQFADATTYTKIIYLLGFNKCAEDTALYNFTTAPSDFRLMIFADVTNTTEFLTDCHSSSSKYEMK